MKLGIVIALALTWSGCRAGPVVPPAPLKHLQAASPSQEVPLAFVNDRRIRWNDLRPGLLEAQGGQILAEVVQDQLIEAHLVEFGGTVDSEQIEAERQIILQSLHEDPDKAQRLLTAVRQRRGMGPSRFTALLKRNAGLRLLVQDRVKITEEAMDRAYRVLHGEKYETRLIIVDSLGLAAQCVRRARGDEAFSDLAYHHSIHASRQRGGLLAAFSPLDNSVPFEIRETLAGLEPGQVSDSIALENGFAILKLERKFNGGRVAFDDVKDELAVWVRRRTEQILSEKLIRELVAAADVIVFDRELKKTWRARIGAGMENN